MNKLTLIGTAAALAFGFAGGAYACPMNDTLTLAQAETDTSGATSGQATSDMPSSGAGSTQLPSPHAEDQGGTGMKGSAQGEGATNKDTAPRDSGSASVPSERSTY